MDLEKDTRPAHSPYASEPCTVSFEDGKTLHIPRELLHQVETISSNLSLNPAYKPCLHGISSETGHVLIHFLICGVYQCFRPQGDSLEERRAAEFRTALDVYVAAESLQLTRLRDLARREITRVGDSLSLPSVISAIEDSNRSLKTLPGVVAYVESRILSFGEEATPEGVSEMLAELEGPNTLSRTLLKTMLLLKSSELSRKQQKFHESEGRGFCEAAGSVLDDEMARARISPTEQAMKEAEARAQAIAEQRDLEEAIQAAKEEEMRLEVEARFEQAELQALRNKKAKKGKLGRRDETRIAELVERSARRAEGRVSRKPESEAPEATSEGQATAHPSYAFPVFSDQGTPTPEASEASNVEKEAEEAEEGIASDRPSSRSSGTWSL